MQVLRQSLWSVSVRSMCARPYTLRSTVIVASDDDDDDGDRGHAVC